MTMTLEQVRDWHRHEAYATTEATLFSEHQAMADAIDAHLTQPAQACEHDWAVGYGVPAYCNHCGVERDPKPAQSVDVEKVRRVAAYIRHWNEAICHPAINVFVDELEAALQEKGNG